MSEPRNGASPSERARALLEGAFDTHLHIAPDVVQRKIDDVSLARRFKELGMAGFVLKSHYTSTAERAAVVRAAVPGVTVLGAIALNRAVGGMNPAGGRNRRPRGRADGVASDRRLGQRIARTGGGAGSEGAGVGQAPARSARAGDRDRSRLRSSTPAVRCSRRRAKYWRRSRVMGWCWRPVT